MMLGSASMTVTVREAEISWFPVTYTVIVTSPGCVGVNMSPAVTYWCSSPAASVYSARRESGEPSDDAT